MTATRFDPARGLRGELRPPPDKSISHRAALVGAMAEGTTRVKGYLDSADTRSSLAAVRALGASVEIEPGYAGGLKVEIGGIGLRGPSPAAIDVGNAGTLLRLLPGWLAGQPRGEWTLDGDQSIRRRPVDRIARPLVSMGAEISCRDERLPPMRIRAATLEGIDYEMPVASAQVKSCLLFAGLMADGPTVIREKAASRDHTERLLAASGAQLSREGLTVTIEPGDGRLDSCDMTVPADFSSAAFPLAAALIIPGSRLKLLGVGLNGTRLGLLAVLARMGARMADASEQDPGELDVAVEAIRDSGPEPLGDLQVRSARLSGTRVEGAEVPLLIDELPLVALLGCFAEGETVVAGAEELHHKESDRIETVVTGLRGLGGEIEATPDGFVVQGTGGLRGGRIEAHGDHRLAMLGAIAGLASREGVEVHGFEAVAVSYPGFEADIRGLALAD